MGYKTKKSHTVSHVKSHNLIHENINQNQSLESGITEESDRSFTNIFLKKKEEDRSHSIKTRMDLFCLQSWNLSHLLRQTTETPP